MVRYDKHPGDITDYPCNWQVPSGITISNVSSTASPVGPNVSASGSAARSITRVAGGTAGVLYQIEETTTFSNGEVRVDEFEVYVLDN